MRMRCSLFFDKFALVVYSTVRMVTIVFTNLG